MINKKEEGKILRVLRSIGFIGLVTLFIVIGTKEVFSQEKGLVLEYDFSEGQGNILKDKSGNGNDGVIFGAKWIKEEKGYSLFFDGVDNYVEVKHSSSLEIGNEFTVEILAKLGENPKKKGFGTYRLIIGKRGEFWDSNSSFALYVDQGSRGFTGYTRYGMQNTSKNNEIYLVSCPVRQPNIWHKIILIKTRNSLALSVDFSPLVSKSIPKKMISSAQPLRIGGVPGRFFKGYIREIKMYNYAKETKGFSFKPKKERKTPYLVMVTSLDERISSTPLLDVKPETIKLLNGSPFDGIAFDLVDIYSGQSPPDEKIVIEKAKELKAISKKDIWVRVNMNRMYQRNQKSPYYDEKWKMEDLAKLPEQGLSVGKVRRMSTPYFSNIKVMDIYDEKGALSDFYRIWRLSLKFCKIMSSGIVLDFESYGIGVSKVATIAKAQGKSVEEVIRRLQGIGAHMVDIVGEEYPKVPIILFFTCLSRPNWDGENHFASLGYVAQGMLMRAKQKKIPLKLIAGGEEEIGYVNRTLDRLKNKISRRWFYYLPWLERFPDNFSLGGTITLWSDPSKISGWAKRDAGDPNPFQSLEDFKPFLKELFSNYDYIWVYQPMVVDYKPFDHDIAPEFHQKLKKVIDEVLKELRK